MNNKELQKELALRLSMKQKEVCEHLSVLTLCMSNYFNNNNAVVLSNLGIFEPRQKPEHLTTLPNSQEKIMVPAKTVLAFKTANSYKEKINRVGNE